MASHGHHYIDTVDADAIDAFFVYLRDERRNCITGKPLSDTTVRDYFLALRAVLNALHKRGTITINPIAHKNARDFAEPEIDRWTPLKPT
jgi:hypothetical protein